MRACPACRHTVPAGSAAQFCSRCGTALAGPPPGLVIELEGVCKSFDGAVVLDNLSLAVPAGECLVIIGMSGSGKSVLLEHLIGFLRPDRGRVLIRGRDIARLDREADLRSVRQEVGLVFQGSALIDSLTAQENVMLPLLARGVPREQAAARAAGLLAEVELTAGAGRYPANLSGGMQKRVALARALIGEPAILLYDEPTTGLDAYTSARISRLMRRLQRRQPGLTSLVITHDYLSAGLVADRVLYLDRDRGRLHQVLGREEIAAIRGEHGESSPQAAAHIRDRLEAFFDDLVVSERPAAPPPPPSWAEALSSVLLSSLRALGAAVLLVPSVGLPRLGADFRKRFGDLCLRSLLVAGAAGLFLGVMLAMQIGRGLNRAAGMVDPLPRIVGSALVERIGPLFLGLLFAGRVAASVSAEIGGKRLSRQFDALRALAISPERYWLAPIFWASVLALPLLCLVLEGCALIGAYLVAVVGYRLPASLFHHQVLAEVTPRHLLFGLARTALFGAAVALVGYARGTEVRRSSEEIGQVTTLAVVGASLAVILLDLLLTSLLPL